MVTWPLIPLPARRFGPWLTGFMRCPPTNRSGDPARNPTATESARSGPSRVTSEGPGIGRFLGDARRRQAPPGAVRRRQGPPVTASHLRGFCSPRWEAAHDSFETRVIEYQTGGGLDWD